MLTIAEHQLWEVFRALAICFFAVIAYFLARQSAKDNGKTIAFIHSLFVCVAIALAMAGDLRKPTCNDSAPVEGGCNDYADDGYVPTDSQLEGEFLFVFMLLTTPAILGILNSKSATRFPRLNVASPIDGTPTGNIGATSLGLAGAITPREVAGQLKFWIEKSIRRNDASVSTESMVSSLASAQDVDTSQIKAWFVEQYDLPPEEYHTVAKELLGKTVPMRPGQKTQVHHYRPKLETPKELPAADGKDNSSTPEIQLWPTDHMHEHQRKFWRNKRDTDGTTE